MNDNKKALEQKHRLEQLVIHLKMNMVDLAELAGLNKNTLYHVGSGNNSEITERSVARICYHLEKKRGIVVNRQWLLDGVGEMIDEAHSVEGGELEKEVHVQAAADNFEQYGEPDWKAKYFALLEKYTALLEGRQK